MVKKARKKIEKNKQKSVYEKTVASLHENKKTMESYWIVKYDNQIVERVDSVDIRIIKALVRDAKKSNIKVDEPSVAKLIAAIRFCEKQATLAGNKVDLPANTIFLQAIADLLSSDITCEEIFEQFFSMNWKKIEAILKGPKKDLAKKVFDQHESVKLFEKYSQ